MLEVKFKCSYRFILGLVTRSKSLQMSGISYQVERLVFMCLLWSVYLLAWPAMM